MKYIPFNNRMKSLFLILFNVLLFSPISYGQVTNIDCSNGQCVLNCGPSNPTCTGSVFTVNPSTKNCSGYDCVVGDIFSTISSSGQNTQAVNISTDLVLKPQNLKMTIENGAFPGQDLTVNLNAKNQNWDYAASFSLFTDNLNQVSVNLDGYSGKKGKDASEICADKIQNGDYGSGVQTFYNARRASDSNINQNKCDLQDLNYMQQFSFSCDDPSYSEISVSNPTVSVQRIKSKARCSAVGSYSDCVKKKVRVNCNYSLWSTAKNRWLTEDDVELQSWVGTKDQYGNTYNSEGEYLSLGSSASYQLCGSYTSSGCISNPYGNQSFSIYPGSSNSCGSGSVPYAYQAIQAGFDTSCNVVEASGSIVSYYKTINSINQKKRTFVSMNRTGVQVGPFDESFFNSESNRLGGINGFCQQYGFSAAVTANPSGFLSGIPGYPMSQTAYTRSVTQEICFGGCSTYTVNITGSYDNAGIPFERVSNASNVNWQSETNAQHSIVFDTSSFARASIWKATSGSTFTYTPEVYNDPQAPNADHWEKLTTNVFQSCPSDFTLSKNNYITLTQYADSSSLCSSVTDPLDPNGLAQWQYTGMSQETIHGVESVSCSIGSCAVNSSVSDLDRNIDVITPGSGEDGTEQGRGLIFAYNIKNLSKTSLAGEAGSKGGSDLSINSQVRICAKIDDATAGINTAQAKNPFVSFRRYNWQSVKSNNAGNNGVPPRQNGKKVEVFKKIDPGLRYFLEKSLN